MKTNTQVPLRTDLRKSGALTVHEIFGTIQGEGPFAGTPAIFVRLAGCNLQCPACDTEYTGGVNYDPEALLDHVDNLSILEGVKTRLIVLTGGEPLRQNIAPFCTFAVDNGWDVQIETNGTLPLPPEMPVSNITVVCSPKTGRVHPQLIPDIDALKYVVEHGYVDERGLPTRALMGSCKVWKPDINLCDIYVQPLDVQDEDENRKHMRVASNSAMKHGYKLCIQMHKIAELP